MSRVWDGPSVKAPLECPLEVIIYLIPEVSGSGHWQEEGESEQCVQLVVTDWGEIIIPNREG